MTSFQSEDLGRAADIAVIVIQLLEDIVALVGGRCLMQGGEFRTDGATCAIPMHQRGQMFAVESSGGRIHDDNALDHVAQFAHVTRPGISRQGVNRVVAEFARPAAVGGGKLLEKVAGPQGGVLLAVAQMPDGKKKYL